MKMKAFYGSRFSPNMTRTPEGFLIAHNVPIARTGWYEYLGDEIGANDQAGEVVKVYRSPEEVFSDGAMASFEGKPVTDEHPPELVAPENAMRYARGSVQNVRQGKGEDSDLLLADLVIYDETLINEVQSGKREVSCGYDVEYVDNGDGTYSQKQIRGNHVAVVSSGRAGNRVAIKDKNPITDLEGAKKMGKNKLPRKHRSVRDYFTAWGIKQFAIDADPEEIQEAVDALAEEKAEDDADQVEESKSAAKDDDQEGKSDAKDDNEDLTAIAALKSQVDKLTELVEKLAQDGSAAQDEDPEKAIDDAISELEKGAQDDDGDEEESHTVPADTMDDEGPVSDPEDRPKDPIPGQDNAYKIQALKAIKPILAAIPDKRERKKAVDAAIASINGKPSKNTYGQMAKRKKKPATDTQQQKQVDHSQLGKEIAKKYNPHYKERA
jgi:hypothetical protein